jgi:hypothetical protein
MAGLTVSIVTIYAAAFAILLRRDKKSTPNWPERPGLVAEDRIPPGSDSIVLWHPRRGLFRAIVPDPFPTLANQTNLRYDNLQAN